MTVMTKKEIDKSWSKAKTKNVQNDFPQEMAKRTVINRAAKQFFNTSDDNDLFIDAVNRTTENEYDNERQVKDITPQETESLDDVLGNPTVSKEKSAENQENPAVEKPQNKVAVSKTETTTPKVDEETGEVLDGEQGELFKELEDLM